MTRLHHENCVRTQFSAPRVSVISFGDRIEPGGYRLHSRFSQAINFIRGTKLVCLVNPQVGGGPVNIVVSGLDFGRIENLRVDEENFSCNGLTLPKKPLYDSGLPIGNIDPDRLQKGLLKLENLLAEHSKPKSLAFLIEPTRIFGSAFDQAFAARMTAGLGELRRKNLEAGTSLLRGAGFGLTPSGDDFLAGWMWGLHVTGKMGGMDVSSDIDRIFRSTKSDNPLSSAFLRCAHEGRFFQPLRDLIAAVALDDEKSLIHSAKKLLASGETSGADTAVGFLIALSQIYSHVKNPRGCIPNESHL